MNSYRLQMLHDKYLVLGWKVLTHGVWITSVLGPATEPQPEFYSEHLTHDQFKALPWVKFEAGAVLHAGRRLRMGWGDLPVPFCEERPILKDLEVLNRSDGLPDNVAREDKDVTCPYCLRLMAKEK